jgi:hypothetical protein
MKQCSAVPAEFSVGTDGTPEDYQRWVASVKRTIQHTQTRAFVANRDIIMLYWELIVKFLSA